MRIHRYEDGKYFIEMTAADATSIAKFLRDEVEVLGESSARTYTQPGINVNYYGSRVDQKRGLFSIAIVDSP